MFSLSLLPRQKILLAKLVKLHLKNRLYMPIRPIPRGAEDYIIYVKGDDSFHLQYLSDLDAFCVQGLMDFKLSRMGNSKAYSLTYSAEVMYANGDLVVPDGPFPPEQVKFDSPATTRRTMMARYTQLTKLLKQGLGRDTNANNLSTALIEMAHIRRLLNSASPNRAQIHSAVQTVGNIVAAKLADSQTFDQLNHISQTTQIFGQWAELITQLTIIR